MPAPAASARRPVLALGLLLLLPTGARALEPEALSRINGAVAVQAGQAVGDVENVNGGVSLAAGASAGSVENVNGGISLADAVRVRSLECVNGGIRAGERLVVAQGVEAVNGGVHLGRGAEIGGDVEAVNGGVEMEAAHVGGKVEIASGTVDTGRGSRIDGGIHVIRGNDGGWGRKKLPRVIVGPDSVVGDIVLERETELLVHESARIGDVSGGSAVRYSGSAP